MVTEREEIEARLTALNLINDEDTELRNRNNLRHKEATNMLEGELLSVLSNAGFPVNEFTRIDLDLYLLNLDPRNRRVSLYFKHEARDSAEVSVRLLAKKLEDVSVTGISSRAGKPEDFVRMGKYYKMVSNILEKLNSTDFDLLMNRFFEVIEAFTYPTMEKSRPDIYKINEERKRLEKELEIRKLNLEAGKEVEVYLEGSSHGRWFESKIIYITDKTVRVSTPYGEKVVYRDDILHRIRNLRAIA
jgi:hypothetical protein